MPNLFELIKKYPLKNIYRRVLYRLRGRVVTIGVKTGELKGRVLLSYTTYPFTLQDTSKSGAHTNYWETIEQAKILNEFGYIVDIIDHDNSSFIPKKRYDIFIDIG